MNRLSFFCFLGVALLVAALPVAAQKRSPNISEPPVQIWQPPRLVVANAAIPISLESVRVQGELAGRQAYTEIELTFFNPNSRVLEGELQFPLLSGQSIAGFAMDVNGVLREAVPVDKARGRQVFEEVIRTRIDPGLLEATQGNNFKLRVYPLPPQGRKHVVLRVTEALEQNGGRVIYRLPAGFGDAVESFSVDVRIAATAKPTALRNPFGDLEFQQGHGAHWYARTSAHNFRGTGVLEIATTVDAVPLVLTQTFEGKTYFLADVPVAQQEAPRTLPRSVGIVWDASGSGAARDHGREFALLDAYFRAMREGTVRLTFLRDTVEPVQVFRITNGDWTALKKVLQQTAYDGATNLGAFQPEAGVGEYLLFSDGLGNFGEQPFAPTKAPLYSISAAVKSDPVFLACVAQRSGGRYVDLVKQTADEGARVLLRATTRVEALDGSGVSDLQLASPFAQGGRVRLAGVLTEPTGKVALRVIQPGGGTRRMEIDLAARGNESLLPAAAWARLRVEELDGEHALHRAEIKRLGQQFKLVTRETSLIVLDRVEDYARYEIAPPPELRADYDRILSTQRSQHARERQSHIEDIVRRFESKLQWWNRDFPKDRAAPVEEQKISTVGVGGVAGVARMRAADATQTPHTEAYTRLAEPPPPPPAAAAAPASPAPVIARSTVVAPPVYAPAQAAPQAGRVERIQVTGSNVNDSSAQITTKLAESANAPGAPRELQVNSTNIQLQKWQPDAPYARRLREAANADLYGIYLDEKPGYAASTAFYLDAADLFIERGQGALAIRILSNLAEMDLENRHVLRVLGYRLMQAKAPALAIPMFKRVLELAPDEPQSYRDLGLAYAAAGQPQKAVDALWEVVVRPWHNRFPDIELVALAELNAIAATSTADTSKFDPRLMKNLPLDLRAVLAWDADNTDIDLWVTDPNGEKAFYGHQLTRQGGRMSQDFTGGYGPEEFSLKTALPGKYKVEAQYFGDRSQAVTGATTLWVRLSTHFGTAQQQDQTVTLRLKDQKEVVLVGEFEVK